MGISYEIKCTGCMFHRTLKSGAGDDFNIFENVLKKYQIDKKKQILRLLKKYGLKTKSRLKNPRYERNPFAEERIYRCRKCGNIESQIYIRISVPEKWMFDNSKNSKSIPDGNILFRTINRCSRCDTRLRHYKDEINSLECPDCKRKDIEIVLKKNWN